MKNQTLATVNAPKICEPPTSEPVDRLDFLPDNRMLMVNESERHIHYDFHQLLVTRRGHCAIEADGRHWDVAPNHVCRVPPGISHRMSFSTDSQVYILAFSDEMLLRRIAPAVSQLEPQLRRHLDQTCRFSISPVAESAQEAEQVFRAIEVAGQWLGKDWDATTMSFLFMVIFRAFYSRSKKVTSLPAVASVGRATDADAKIVSQFRDSVDQNFRDHHSIAEYCKMVGVSRARLIKACRNVVGLSPLEFIHERQLREAKCDLVYSGRSATEIAYGLGFTDPAYFSRFFKRKTGYSPAEFRRSLFAQRSL